MSEEVTAFRETAVAEDGIVFANRVKILVGLLVFVGAVGYLGFVAFRSATVYYYTVGELNGLGPTPDGATVRVSGKLVPDSFARDDGSTLARFDLTDGSEFVSATHVGILPDLFFNEHSDIILEGRYLPGGVFESQNVIVKCPSKYIAVN